MSKRQTGRELTCNYTFFKAGARRKVSGEPHTTTALPEGK